MFEQELLHEITAQGQLAAYMHDAFWQPMDTFHEFTLLNSLCNGGRAPWKVL